MNISIITEAVSRAGSSIGAVARAAGKNVEPLFWRLLRKMEDRHLLEACGYRRTAVFSVLSPCLRAYGLLHSTEYRTRFENDLKKELPRIPMVAKFREFSKADRKLAKLHLGYESADLYPATVEMQPGASYRIEDKMRFPKKGVKDVIVYNSGIVIRGIPEEAYEYVVNGKSAIEWVMERYAVTTDKASGIVNDPNLWCEEHGDEKYILNLLLRVITVSVETVKIVKAPPLLGIID